MRPRGPAHGSGHRTEPPGPTPEECWGDRGLHCGHAHSQGAGQGTGEQTSSPAHTTWGCHDGLAPGRRRVGAPESCRNAAFYSRVCACMCACVCACTHIPRHGGSGVRASCPWCHEQYFQHAVARPSCAGNPQGPGYPWIPVPWPEWGGDWSSRSRRGGAAATGHSQEGWVAWGSPPSLTHSVCLGALS